jgi:hypothetical protein
MRTEELRKNPEYLGELFARTGKKSHELAQRIRVLLDKSKRSKQAKKDYEFRALHSYWRSMFYAVKDGKAFPLQVDKISGESTGLVKEAKREGYKIVQGRGEMLDMIGENGTVALPFFRPGPYPIKDEK